MSDAKGDSRGNPALVAAAKAARKEAEIAAVLERAKALLGESVQPLEAGESANA